MTHKTVEFTIRRTWHHRPVYAIHSLISPDAGEYFKIGSQFMHALLEKMPPSDNYRVKARINTSSKTKRRYILSITSCSSEQEDSELANVEFANAYVSTLASPEIKIQHVTPQYKKYYIEPEHAEIFNTATRMSATNPDRPVRILMVGPSGYGKTSLPRQYADAKGLTYYRMNCASVRDPEEWFGYRVARDGSTLFEPSEFMNIVQKGHAVVVLDEFNRLEQWLTNTLYPLLDDDASTTIYNQNFKVGPGVIFVMTINLGYQYSGTFVMDAALTNRVDMFCKVGPLPANIEAEVLMANYPISDTDAQNIVKTATSVRALETVECSTRTTLMIARLVASGASVRTAYQHVVIARCLADQSIVEATRSVIDAINTRLGVYRCPTTNEFS